MKKYMPLEGLRWSRDSGSALCDTSQNSRSRTGWGGKHAMQWIEFQIEDNYRGRISCRGYLPSKLAVDFLAQLN